jgi:hypothetical protein
MEDVLALYAEAYDAKHAIPGKELKGAGPEG